MPLQFAPHPQDGLNFVDQKLDAYQRMGQVLKSPPRAGQPALPLKPPIRPTLKAANDSYAPHPLYFLVIEDLLPGGAGLEAARPWGFYYVLENNQRKPFARAHVVADASGQLSLMSLSFGAYSRDAVPSLEKLAVHHRVRAGSYEVRALRCKHLFFAAVWLKALDGGADLLHPLEKHHYLLGGEPPYPSVDFIAALRPVAGGFAAKYQAIGARQSNGGPSGLAP